MAYPSVIQPAPFAPMYAFGQGGGGGAGLPISMASRVAAQTIPNATWTTLIFDTELIDTLGLIDLSTAPTKINGAPNRKRVRFTVVSANGGWVASGTGARGVRLLKNGGQLTTQTIAAAPGVPQELNYLSIYHSNNAAGTDYYQIQVYQSSGGNLALSNVFVQAEWRD